MRVGVDVILQKRAERRTVILFTGGTSFLGGRIATDLLNRGFRLVFLCRSKGGTDATERIRRTLEWFGFDGPHHYEVIPGDLTCPGFGLPSDVFRDLAQRVDEIHHIAASTSFLESHRDELRGVNLQGTKNVLDLAAEGNCTFFHYMSTAYVAGAQRGTCAEDYVPQTVFNNPYEETKHQCEELVLKACRQRGIRTNILRPSIVYGDSTTGRALKFSALYFPIRSIHYLTRVFDETISEKRGKLAAQMGIRRDGDRRTSVPIRYETMEGSMVNVIPIDFLGKAYQAIVDSSLEGDVFHIVRRDHQSVDELIRFTEKYLNVCGLQPVPKQEFDAKPRTALEKLFYSYVDVYHAYLHDMKVFDDTKATQILTQHGITCPELTYDVFKRCIDYALATDWGKKTFDQPKGRVLPAEVREVF